MCIYCEHKKVYLVKSKKKLMWIDNLKLSNAAEVIISDYDLILIIVNP